MIRLLRCRHNRIRSSLAKVLVICILITFVLIVYQHQGKSAFDRTFQHPEIMKEGQQHKGHLMCILIPFRNRLEELTEFVPRITQFLDHQSIKNKIVVINQVGGKNVLDFYNIIRDAIDTV